MLPGAITMLVAGPASAVAVNCAGVAFPSTVAVTRWKSAVALPRVHVVEARPPASLVVEVVESDPPPETTAKVTARFAIGWPSRSSMRTCNAVGSARLIGPDCACPPTTTGVTGTCATVTVALEVIPSSVAEMFAVPLVTAVTNPLAETVATAGALEDQVTAAPAIVLPRWSATVALSCCVAPRASSATFAADSAIVVTLAGSVLLVQAWPNQSSAARMVVRASGRVRRMDLRSGWVGVDGGRGAVPFARFTGQSGRGQRV